MVETSTTHIIFFIASLIVASIVVGVCTSVIYSLQTDISIKGDLLSDALTGDIKIINDENVVPNNPVIIYVLNTGKTTLNYNSTNVLIDGELIADTNVTITVQNTTQWRPNTVIKIEITRDLAEGDHYCKVSIDELEDSLKFKI